MKIYLSPIIEFLKTFTREIAIILVLTVIAGLAYEHYKDYQQEQLLEHNSQAVVQIITYDKDGKELGSGSGFFIDTHGTLVTNYHVIADKTLANIEIKTSNGTYYKLKGAGGYSPSQDIAILKVEASETPKVQVGNSDSIKIGDHIFTIGNPLEFEHSISEGIISYKTRKIGTNEFIQFTAPISPGSSGGGLFNSSGKVIGITSSYAGKDFGSQNLNFAVPINKVKDIVRKESISLSDASPEYYYSLGVLNKNRHQYGKAIEYFLKAISLNSNFVDAYIDLSYSYFLMRDFNAEVIVLEQAANIAPTNPDVLSYLATAYEDIGSYDKALDTYERFLKYKDDDQEDLFQIAILYMVKGDNAKAKTIIYKLSQLNRGTAGELKAIYEKVTGQKLFF